MFLCYTFCAMRLFILTLVVTIFTQVGAQEATPHTAPSTAPERGSSISKLHTQQKASQAEATDPGTSPVSFANKCADCYSVEKPQTQTETEKAKAASLDDLTRRYMWATIIGVIGAWVGLGILIVQTIISRHTAQRQLRAYVFTNTSDILEGTIIDPPRIDKTNFPFVHVTIKNSGQTPAYDVISWLQIDVTVQTEERTLVVSTPIQRGSTINLGPGGTFTKFLWFHRPVTAPEISEIASGVRGVYAYGRIEYIDAFKVRRFTNFRLKYTGVFPPPPNSIFNFCESGNDAN